MSYKGRSSLMCTLQKTLLDFLHSSTEATYKFRLLSYSEFYLSWNITLPILAEAYAFPQHICQHSPPCMQKISPSFSRSPLLIEVAHEDAHPCSYPLRIFYTQCSSMHQNITNKRKFTVAKKAGWILTPVHLTSRVVKPFIRLVTMWMDHRQYSPTRTGLPGPIFAALIESNSTNLSDC